MIRSSIEEAISRKYPEAVVMVVSCDREGRPNVMPAGWFMFTSGNPPMVAVSIAPQRYTHKLISETGEFVITVPSEGQEKMIDQCGSCSGRDVDKFREFDIPVQSAEIVEPPLIEGSVAAFECKKEAALTTGDHTIFSGIIVAAHVSREKRLRVYNLGGGGPESYRALLPKKD